MSAAGQTFEIARRDFMQRAKSKAFLITLAVVVGMVLIGGQAVAFLREEPAPYQVGVVGSSPVGFANSLAAQAGSFDEEALARSFPDLETGVAALERGEVDVLVVDQSELVWHEEPDVRLAAIVAAAVYTQQRQEALDELGLTAEQLRPLLAPDPLTERELVAPDPEEEPRRAGATVGLMLLYISILLFGQFVLMGVMEEKQSRVVEVVLSRVRPHQLIAGKVLGIGALGLAQLVVLGAAIWATVALIDLADISVAGLGAEILASILFWFLIGYAVYSVVYAGLGATVSRQEDVQGSALLPALLIVPGFFFGQIAVTDPDAPLAVVTSMIPFWSPMVMPMRLAVGDVPLWQVATAIVLALVTIVGLIRLAGRIYTGAILSLGSKVRLRDAWRGART